MRGGLVASLVVLAAACASTPAAGPSGNSTVAAVGSTPMDHPRVVERHIKSQALGVRKRYYVVLPPSYAARPNARYPVFYYLHGLGGNEQDWLYGGELTAVTAREGIEAIIVLPDGDDSFYADAVAPAADLTACRARGDGLFYGRYPERQRTCTAARGYETYLVDELVAEVDASFRTIADKRGRAIAGLSMGGFGALSLALRNPERFAAAASHSGFAALLFAGPFPYPAGQPAAAITTADVSTWGRALGEFGAWMRGVFGPELANWQAHDPVHLVRAGAAAQVALYLDCGTNDLFALQHHATYLHDVLTEVGVPHQFYLGPGDHSFRFWSTRVDDSLRFLTAHTAAPE